MCYPELEVWQMVVARHRHDTTFAKAGVRTGNISVDLARPTSASSISQVAISLARKSNTIFPVRDAASDVRLLILAAPCATILLATGRPRTLLPPLDRLRRCVP